MSSSGHDQDRLLDYAYDELPPAEAKSLEAHLKSCPQCSRALDDIRKVRRTMAQLPTVPAPAAGLDSLLAYAQQAARRAEAGRIAHSRLWKWVLLPSTGALVVVLLTVVSTRVAQETRLSQLKSVAARKVTPPSSSPPVEPFSDEYAIDRQSSSAIGGVVGAGPAESPMEKDPAAKAEAKSPAKIYVSKPTSRPEPERARASVQASPAAEPRAAVLQALPLQQSTGDQRAAPKQAPQAVKSQLEESAALSDESPGTTRGAVSNRAMSYGSPPSAPATGQSHAVLEKEIARTRDMLRNEKVVGLERAWLLNHLCELLYAANHPSEADSTCDQVIRDFSGSAAADAARQLKAKNLQDQPR